MQRKLNIRVDQEVYFQVLIDSQNTMSGANQSGEVLVIETEGSDRQTLNYWLKRPAKRYYLVVEFNLRY